MCIEDARGRDDSLIWKGGNAYIGSVGWLTRLFIILADFMEVVLVELSDEARKITVFEVLRKYWFGEFFALEIWESLITIAYAYWALSTAEQERKWGIDVRLTSNTTKLSLSSPQRTICEYDGSSSILPTESLSETILDSIHNSYSYNSLCMRSVGQGRQGFW